MNATTQTPLATAHTALAATEVIADIDSSSRARITCPFCGKVRDIDAAPFTAINGPLKASCPCGGHFQVRFRRKLTARFKTVCLAGEFTNVSANSDRGEMLVEGLAMTGLTFSSIGRHNITPGDAMKLYFVLDNARRSEIRKSGVVKEINGRTITVEFYNAGGMDADLGFYLRA